jgi:hypothetical protein
MNIINSSVFMKSEPTETSPLETECLFGESVEILENFAGWVYCKLLTDNYFGWIKKNSLGKLINTTHRIINKNSFVYKEPSEKSNILLYLPLGSRLVVEKIKFGWAEINFNFKNKIHIGYVPSKHIVINNLKVEDWVSVAQQLEGIPYRWGGRDTIGIDCSALLQLSYQAYREDIPRNTSEQIKLTKPILDKLDDLKRGSVVFWKGHVAIMIDKTNCIHANAFHMKTKTEALIDVINRMEKNNNILSMMDFN